MPSIEVSSRTYRRIESLAKPFKDKTPEDVVIRALASLERTQNGRGPKAGTKSRADLRSRAGRVPHGTKLRADYKGTRLEAEIQDGRVIFEGRPYKSVSRAAVAAIRSTGSKRPTENGWRFWSYYHPGRDQWRPLEELQRSEMVDELRTALGLKAAEN